MTTTNPPSRDNLGPSPKEVMATLRRDRDVMGISVLSMLNEIDADIAIEGEWDQPPRLFSLRRRMAPPELLAELSTTGLRADLVLLEVNEIGNAIFAGLSGAQIAASLDRFTTLARKENSAVLKLLQQDAAAGAGDLVGWLLVNEAYISIGNTTEASVYAQASEDPDRLEIRFLLCVDISGAEFYMMHRRDTDSVHVWHNSSDSDVSMGGRITDALRELVAATAGVT